MASQEVKQQLIWHVQNRKRVKQMYKRKGIQMLDKPELMFSDIKEPKLNPQQASMYQAMKIELTEKGYSDFRFLGQGAQGLVLLAKDFKNQMRYAIKGVQVRDLQGNLYDEVYNKVKQEIDILKQCRGSPYVVSLLDSFEGKQFMYLVLNECQGTLTEIIESKLNKRLNEISAIKYAKDITEGLYYIHSKNCLVNDLKMDNILIDYNGNAVVSDFGLADKLTVKSGYSHNQYMGNFIYQAPECYDPTDKIIGKVYYDEYQKLGIQVKQEPSNRSEACSLGYIIYSLIQGIDFNLVFNKHKPLNYDGEFQNFVYKKNLQELIDGLTQFVPRKRLPIKEALIVLKGIISLEFQLDELLIQMIDGDTQKLASSLKNEIEFIQDLSNQFYPIIKNQQNLIQELKEDPEKILLEAKLAELEQANFMLKETISQSEEKTKALIDKLQKQEEILKNQLQNNTQKKMKGFMKQVRVNVLEVQDINKKKIGYINLSDCDEKKMMILYEDYDWKKQIGKVFLRKDLAQALADFNKLAAEYEELAAELRADKDKLRRAYNKAYKERARDKDEDERAERDYERALRALSESKAYDEMMNKAEALNKADEKRKALLNNECEYELN